jgi:hypothetical protein
MDWDHDVCLSCDRQTADGEKFCSQACRLTDLERAGHSEPATPSSLPTNAPSWMAWQLPTASGRSHFQLAPPVNFSAYRNSANAESPPNSPKTRPFRKNSASYFQLPTTTTTTTSASTSYSQPSQRGLFSSPSRSSLSSVSSSSTSSTVNTPGLSSEVVNQLRDYSGAFDTVRDWKRRVTYG